MGSKQGLKPGEKILFGIFGVFCVAAVIGYAVLEYVRLNSDKPLFEANTHYVFTEEGLRGSVIFRESGCTSCHRAMRNGTNMGLNLDGSGTRRTEQWLLDFLQRPEEMYGYPTVDHGQPPKEAASTSTMAESDQRAIASFLYGLKSEQGSPSSPLPPKGDSQFIDNMVKMMAPSDWKDKYQDIRERDSEESVEPEVSPEESQQ